MKKYQNPKLLQIFGISQAKKDNKYDLFCLYDNKFKNLRQVINEKYLYTE